MQNLLEMLAKQYGVQVRPYIRLAILECPQHEEGNDDCTCITEWRATLWGNLYRETKAQYNEDGSAIIYVFYCYVDYNKEGDPIFLPEPPLRSEADL